MPSQAPKIWLPSALGKPAAFKAILQTTFSGASWCGCYELIPYHSHLQDVVPPILGVILYFTGKDYFGCVVHIWAERA